MSQTAADDYQKVKAVKEAHESELMSRPNVVGVGIGLRQRGGERTDEVVLVVMVRRKVPESQLSAEGTLPAEIEGVPVDVQETGELEAQT